ncbi:TSUP family transporter [Candidatus Nitrosacidococcus tergens]|uniref:Probable membrane transporter protein n=1 Tax=Candidatus Nitrosacidococcus tergens TaxID=553981 RepID=A0A7G1Q7R9_9GAMM|nr:TSUP family transporter [Candidatus Nitrosacidococcus tergens]CAB1274180.1 conserved membrane protein of unknown function [Candidatus Nitrosacidococcus tergens]
MLSTILIIIVITASIQALFGVGVLLFGTPLLLLIDYPFIDALIILLPISISINLLQIIKNYPNIDWLFYKKILFYTIPFVVIFLYLVTRISLNIGLIIGLFLVFVALKSTSQYIAVKVEKLMHYERIYFIAMGIVHGLTNLGGSLLTAAVHATGGSKDRMRGTAAISYGTFAIFQLATLSAVALKEVNISWSHLTYLAAGISAFFIADHLVYTKINNEQYSKIFAGFLFISGISLIGKSIQAIG